MKCLRSIVFASATLASFIASNVSAQRFENLNMSFPMGPSEVLFQDSDGFLWIGTINGLARYDGYSTQIYAHDPHADNSLAGNNINAIGQDQNGRIWVGIRSYGLDILDTEGHIFRHICLPDTTNDCRQHVSVNAFACEDSAMWVGTDYGLLQYSCTDDPKLLQSHLHDPQDPTSLSDDYIIDLLLDRQTRLWIGTAQGINLYDRISASFTNFNTNTSYSDSQILDIAQDKSNVIWICPRFSMDRLETFNEGTGNFDIVPGFHGRSFGEFRLAFDHNDNTWISSRGTGAYQINATTNAVSFINPEYASAHGFLNLYSLQTLCDTYGNVWFTGNSVLKWPASGKAIAAFDSPGGPILSVFSNDSTVWFSAFEPMRFDKRTGKITQFWPQGIPTNVRIPEPDMRVARRVYHIIPLDEDHILMSSTRSIFVWNLRNDSYREYAKNYGGPFRDFALAPDQHHVWICGNQGAPVLLNLDNGVETRETIARHIPNARCMTIEPNGTLWFGTSTNGVYSADARTSEIVNFVPDSPDTSRKITDYFINDVTYADGRIWIATNLGLNVIDTLTHSVKAIRRQEHFENESVMSVVADTSGAIWLGTQQGIVRFDPEASKFTHFGVADGLINVGYIANATYRDTEGTLYFGGDRGVDIINPGQMGINSVPPDLYLSQIKVNDNPIDTLLDARHISNIDLEYFENFIEIELLALHLTAPLSNTYAYRIAESGDQWRLLGTARKITLANIRPGRYTVIGKAANADGIWSDPKQLLTIRIRPPFWKTWWFIAIVGIGVVGILILGYRFRVKQIETRERLKTEFNQRIAELESKALRAQMNPHFLFNSINSVKSLISQGDNDKATQYLTRFGQLIRQVLANSEKPLVRLQEELEALRLYMEIEQLRFQNFEFSLSVGDDVNQDFIEVPPLILQPYVENAIWHGLMHKTTGDRRVDVEVMREVDSLVMSVTDNGIGRVRARQLKMLGTLRKSGMGMRLTGDRLELLKKSHGRDVQVTISDLYDHEDNPSGTRVTIHIPHSE